MTTAATTPTFDTGRELYLNVLIEQIGRMTLASIGAYRRWIVLGPSAVETTITRGHRVIRITLEANDTYTVQTIMRRSGRIVFERRGVYCDQMADTAWDAHVER
jgi:hypothetical protein